MAAAVAAACLFAVRGELEGDFKGVVISDLTTLLVATGSIVIAYLVCMGPVYNWMESVRVKPMLQSPLVDESRYCEWLLSILVFLIQLTFLVFCLVEQVGIAGSTRLSYLPLKYVWVLFPADAIFWFITAFTGDRPGLFPIWACIWFPMSCGAGSDSGS